jgi:hypothetical protein
MNGQRPNVRVKNTSGKDVTVPWDSQRYTVAAGQEKIFTSEVGMQFMRRARIAEVKLPNGAVDLVEQLEIEEVTGSVELVEKSAILTLDGRAFESTADLAKYVEEKTLAAVKEQGEPGDEKRRGPGRPRKNADDSDDDGTAD